MPKQSTPILTIYSFLYAKPTHTPTRAWLKRLPLTKCRSSMPKVAKCWMFSVLVNLRLLALHFAADRKRLPPTNHLVPDLAAEAAHFALLFWPFYKCLISFQFSKIRFYHVPPSCTENAQTPLSIIHIHMCMYICVRMVSNGAFI